MMMNQSTIKKMAVRIMTSHSHHGISKPPK
jgi:hypothetical protein